MCLYCCFDAMKIEKDFSVLTHWIWSSHTTFCSKFTFLPLFNNFLCIFFFWLHKAFVMQLCNVVNVLLFHVSQALEAINMKRENAQANVMCLQIEIATVYYKIKCKPNFDTNFTSKFFNFRLKLPFFSHYLTFGYFVARRYYYKTYFSSFSFLPFISFVIRNSFQFISPPKILTASICSNRFLIFLYNFFFQSKINDVCLLFVFLHELSESLDLSCRIECNSIEQNFKDLKIKTIRNGMKRCVCVCEFCLWYLFVEGPF